MPTVPNFFDVLDSQPGQSPRDRIPFDRTLSVDLFEHITAHMAELTEKEQYHLKGIIKGYGEEYGAGPTFKKLVNRNHELMSRTIEAAGGNLSFHNAMAPSLMVWALNQGWPEEEFYHEQMIGKWLSRCLDSRSMQGTIIAATQFVARLLALAPKIPEDVRSRFLGDLLEELYLYAAPWKNPQHADLTVHYLRLVHTTSLLCNDIPNTNGVCLRDLWCTKAVLTLSEALGDTKPAVATWLAMSDLPLKDRQDVFSWSGPDTWLIPCVSRLLQPTLPAGECARFQELPWATSAEGGALTNRALVQMYCPNLFPLIELAVQVDDWGTRESIAAWVGRFDAPEKDTLALPDDCTVLVAQ